AFASEFDVLNDGPPKDTYVVDDAGVLSRVTRSDLKNLLSDLEYRKKIRINFVTVRKLTSKADAFEYADQVLERWYPTLEEGNNKGIVVLVTSQKEGAITGGPEFIKAVGDTVLDATLSQNLPVLATDEKYNEAIFSSAKRLAAAIDGLPDPGGPQAKDNKRESNFKTKEETAEKRD
ncbi:TPM domain-containing protein, partial [Nitriliruptoraceae bacterium ZYF776]|nr:TPM domain-containing protein [Profundirhabdus halotolerans]